MLARAYYEQKARYFADYGQMALRPGELCYLAVASTEPPGVYGMGQASAMRVHGEERRPVALLALPGVEDRGVIRSDRLFGEG